MKNINRTIIHFALLIFLIFSCKTTQVSTSFQPPQQPFSATIKPLQKDSLYLITQAGDTLENLSQEVEIGISRYLQDTVTIVGVGDIMNGTNFPNASYLPDGDGFYLWKEAMPFLKKADITFGNLEGTILNDGGEQKECVNPKVCYLFRSPEYLATNLSKNGFDLLSLANNHANDFGETGRLNTQRVLDSLGIAHAGSLDQPYVVKKIGHLKVGFCAFAPNRGTESIHQYEKIKSTLQYLNSVSDIVIGSFHAGAEGSKHQHVTREQEYYYGEDRGNVFELAHLMVDNGADVVFGHGPHIARAVELYKGRFIAYSLGNFLTYGRFNLGGLAGEAPVVELKTDATGKFIIGRIHSFRQSYVYGPQMDLNLSSIGTIRKLSLEDFPENAIAIDEAGNIVIKNN